MKKTLSEINPKAFLYKKVYLSSSAEANAST